MNAGLIILHYRERISKLAPGINNPGLPRRGITVGVVANLRRATPHRNGMLINLPFFVVGKSRLSGLIISDTGEGKLRLMFRTVQGITPRHAVAGDYQSPVALIDF